MLISRIPGDSGLARCMLESLVAVVHAIIPLKQQQSRGVLSHLLALYADSYATPAIKDHIFSVIHPALAALPWSDFRPQLGDVDAMMKIISQFLPQCHAFLGTIFVQMDWQTFVVQQLEQLAQQQEQLRCSSSADARRLVPALFCLLVKLSSEPSVRQSGRLLGILTQAERWPCWRLVEATHYESLAQWFVMSVDGRCIIKHKERSLLDAAVIRLFLAAAEFDSRALIPLEEDVADSSAVGRVAVAADGAVDNATRKQLIWVRCSVKLLASVCSKQKNFLSHNQPALHVTLRRILEAIAGSTVARSSSSSSNTSSGLWLMVKEFLAVFNTPASSVLPGAALTVTQSWLAVGHAPALLPALLGQVGGVVREPLLVADLLEATLESFFRDRNNNNSSNRSEDNCRLPSQPPSWRALRAVIRLPSGTALGPVLEAAVKSGHCLLLYSYFDVKQANSLSVQEELGLATTLLEYLRTIAASVNTLPATTSNLEAKLPLLYRLLVVFVQRQLAFANEPGRVADMVGQLAAILANLADASAGWGQNILGAIGLGSAIGSGDPISVRGKFLARALAIFLRSLLNPEKTALIEKIMDTTSASEGVDIGDQSKDDLKSRVLDCPEVKQQLERLVSLQRSKGLAGLSDLVGWVMVQAGIYILNFTSPPPGEK